jgi:hypothetical protein
MGWVRCHRRFGARLGFAALALQIVLSFGHIHIGNVHVEGVARSAAVALANVFGPAQPATLAQAQHKAPAHNPGPSSGDNDDYCAICASIFLASTSLAAQPPILPVPLGFARVAPTFDADAGIGASPPAFFRSRAPPTA